jgi:hypothetical protein
VNSCANSPEDGPVGPKHVEIRRYMNKIEIVTSVGFFIPYVEKMHGKKSLKNLSCYYYKAPFYVASRRNLAVT